MKRRFNTVLMLGLFALCVANIGGYILRRHTGLGESITDPVSGFLMGVAIATLLIGVFRQKKLNGSGCVS